MKKTLAETMLANTLTEREMALASGNTKRLDMLNAEIERLREQVAHERCADFISYGRPD